MFNPRNLRCYSFPSHVVSNSNMPLLKETISYLSITTYTSIVAVDYCGILHYNTKRSKSVSDTSKYYNDFLRAQNSEAYVDPSI